LFKFAKPDHREQLVIDSGFRCHLTDFGRTTAAAPSPFVARLRKYLKTRRVTSVAQVGTDRILEIQFSDGQYRLFFEFYAGGNIVLTDKDLTVLALLRIVGEGAEHEHVRPGGQYNLSERQNINGVPPLTTERIKDGLQKFVSRQGSEGQTQSKKSKRRTADTLRKALAGSINEYPPLLLEHALAVTGFDAAKTPEEVLASDELIKQVYAALEEAGRTVEQIMRPDTTKGYIMAKRSANGTKSADAVVDDEQQRQRGGLMYNEFHPFKPKQFLDDDTIEILEFDGFNRTVDEFFSSIEGQKLESRLQEKEENARKKLEHAKQDQQRRIGGLEEVQSQNVRKAQAIEANLARVEEATKAINDLIARGMDWSEIDKIIEIEQARGNPVAQIIVIPLKLEENTATMKLAEQDYEEEDDDDEAGLLTDSEPESSDSENETSRKKASRPSRPDSDKRLAVDIDLALSGYSNAREYYDQKKTAAAKQEKTVLASTKALKSAQVKIEADLRKALKQEKQVLRPVRKQFWFEKFIYFISSDGYLIVGGKDAQQTDLIYRKNLKKGDVFVSADLSGAASLVIKNNPSTPDAPIPPSTLSQAGTMSVATSTAWDSKAVFSAWWVPAEQVSKLAATGDVMRPGDFHIKGTKNFLPPAQLLLGFAVVWQISDDSKARHSKHRVPSNSTKDSAAAADTAEAGLIAEQAAQATDDELTENDAHTDAASETASEHNNDDNEDTSSAYANPLQGRKVQHADDEEDNDSSADEDAHSDVHVVPEKARKASPTEALPHVEDTSSVHDDADEESEGEASTEATHSSTISTTPGKAAASAAPVRGKRGKKKKIAAKYQDQDDEDRELAMRILGSKAGQEKAAEEAAAKQAKAAAAAEAKERRRLQHEKAQREGRELEAQRAREAATGGADDDDDDDDQDTRADAVDLETLVGAPLVGDELLEAIPVCAPWAALGRYKYKVKLQPGSQKKGKAVREILAKWGAAGANRKWVDERAEDVERIWPREVELIKAWRETEVFNVMPVSKVRVMMGGAGNVKDIKAAGKARGGRGSKKR